MSIISLKILILTLFTFPKILTIILELEKLSKLFLSKKEPIKKRTYSSVNYTPVYTYQGTTGLTYNDLIKNLANLLVNYKVSSNTNLGTLGTIARQGSTQNFDLRNVAQQSNLGSLTNLSNLGILGYGS